MHSEDIIKSALLGTDKYIPNAPSALTEWDSSLQATKEDKEDYFLKLAVGALLFDELGTDPVKVTDVGTVCPCETKEYISIKATSLLNQLLQTKEELLFSYFINLCWEQGKVVTPEFVPELLDKAFVNKNKESALSLVEVCGETGKWLTGLSESWSQLFNPQGTDIWETGSFVQRKSYLKQLREQDLRAVIPLLEKTIAEETASNRQEFLEIFAIGLSLDDESFLTGFIADRSKVIKQTVYNLLRSLRGSALNLSYIEFLKKVLSVQEQRAFIIVKKKSLVISKEFTPDKELFESGIGKISSQKGVDDSDFWVSELIQYVHPEDLASLLGTTVGEALELFLDHPQKKLFTPSLIQAVNTYRYTSWLDKLIDQKEVDGKSLIHLMNVTDRYKYLEQLLENELSYVIQLVCDLDENELIPAAFAENFF